ncbi:MAG: hypothetical protein PHI85_03060 [Victivallaceae bacterium]|nr:hypothetical protein [Victivallaceae bacterium]
MNVGPKKYTLVEVALVMTIIAVVLSLTLLTVNKMVAAQKLDTAAARLAGAVSRARNLAVACPVRDNTVATNPLIAMLMPVTSKFEDWGGDACRSYRFCKVEKNGSGYKFAGWLPDSGWENFGDGVVIAGIRSKTSGEDAYSKTASDYIDTEYTISKNAYGDRLNDSDMFFYGNNNWDALKVTDVPLGSDTRSAAANADCPGIVFDKFGKALNASGVTVIMAEGLVSRFASDKTPYFRFLNTYKNVSDSASYAGNWLEMRVELFSGQPQIRFQGKEWGADK